MRPLVYNLAHGVVAITAGAVASSTALPEFGSSPHWNDAGDRCADLALRPQAPGGLGEQGASIGGGGRALRHWPCSRSTSSGSTPSARPAASARVAASNSSTIRTPFRSGTAPMAGPYACNPGFHATHVDCRNYTATGPTLTSGSRSKSVLSGIGHHTEAAVVVTKPNIMPLAGLR
jgi:hypothetical protein